MRSIAGASHFIELNVQTHPKVNQESESPSERKCNYAGLLECMYPRLPTSPNQGARILEFVTGLKTVQLYRTTTNHEHAKKRVTIHFISRRQMLMSKNANRYGN
jgi:hypothetical protein